MDAWIEVECIHTGARSVPMEGRVASSCCLAFVHLECLDAIGNHLHGAGDCLESEVGTKAAV